MYMLLFERIDLTWYNFVHRFWLRPFDLLNESLSPHSLARGQTFYLDGSYSVTFSNKTNKLVQKSNY